MLAWIQWFDGLATRGL